MAVGESRQADLISPDVRSKVKRISLQRNRGKRQRKKRKGKRKVKRRKT